MTRDLQQLEGIPVVTTFRPAGPQPCATWREGIRAATDRTGRQFRTVFKPNIAHNPPIKDMDGHPVLGAWLVLTRGQVTRIRNSTTGLVYPDGQQEVWTVLWPAIHPVEKYPFDLEDSLDAAEALKWFRLVSWTRREKREMDKAVQNAAIARETQKQAAAKDARIARYEPFLKGAIAETQDASGYIADKDAHRALDQRLEVAQELEVAQARARAIPSDENIAEVDRLRSVTVLGRPPPEGFGRGG